MNELKSMEVNSRVGLLHHRLFAYENIFAFFYTLIPLKTCVQCDQITQFQCYIYSFSRKETTIDLMTVDRSLISRKLDLKDRVLEQQGLLKKKLWWRHMP